MTNFLWIVRFGVAATAVFCALLPAAGFAQEGPLKDTVVPDKAFDAAPFGKSSHDNEGRSYAVQWDEPRKIRRIEVDFAPDSPPPAINKVRVQYWHRHWDGKPEPILADAAAGKGGWAFVDDWTNGKWKDADVRRQHEGGHRWTFTFAPTGEKEFPAVGQNGVAYRRTLKVRLLGEGPLPRPARFQTFTDAECRPLAVRILWGDPARTGLSIGDEDAGRLEVFNGAVRALRAASDHGASVGPDMQWRLSGRRGGLEAELLMAVDRTGPRYDRTIITVRSKQRPFSFAADEVARGDRILVDDLGVLVTRGDDTISLKGYRQARKEFPGRTVYDRVSDTPEQTLSRAWNDMPLKHPLAFVHGLPGNRNAMRQNPNGEIMIGSPKRWFHLPRSPRDGDRKKWEGDWLSLAFGFPPEGCRAGRELTEGYLPLLRTWWVDGAMYYEQCTVLDKLDGDLGDVRLDDPTVLLMQVRVLNVSASTAGVARLHLTSRAAKGEALVLEGDRVLARGVDRPRLRCLLDTGGRGTLTQAGDAIDWSLELAAGQSHTLLVRIPAVTLTEKREIDALRGRDFAADSRRICRFWEDLGRQGAQIQTPEPWLNDFYKAHLRHMEINCFRDPSEPRRYPHVGTFQYGVFANESVMMVSDLDRRGCHKAAEQCLQTWLDFQGSVPLPGNFKSTAGLFYGAGGHEAGGYNKHHGYVMWCMAEHWRYTRDHAWMERAAPKLVEACEWVIRERGRTMVPYADGTRPIEFGFLPSGGLEDVQDYWHWLATNACTVWGFDALTDALADYGHPEAARLKKEARAYREDVTRGLEESRIRSPVVRLRDGTYVPKYSSHLHQRGRSVGWIRETLEGSILLFMTGLVPPDSPQAGWIVKDYEDNLYISDEYGYAIPAFEQFWFSRGGFSMQANLLDGPIAYLLRGDARHYVRAFFNGFSSAFYPEVRMCNEHSLPELGYPMGDYFKTSDEAQLTYWLRLMFVHERGDELHLGRAIPRYWLATSKPVGIERAASHFGPLSLRIESQADRGQITAVVTPPERNPPKTIYLCLRHPQAKPIQSVTLNGAKYDRFDAQKEWIVLPGDLHGPQEVVAHY